LPETSQAPDPRLAGELAVVVMLRRNADAVAPDAAARDRMRTTVFARLAEPEPVTPEPVTPAPAAPRTRKVTSTRGRVAIALAAAFCLVLALSGMTLFLSRNALPGDPLYGVRRTVESASLGLTMGDDAKGRKHLEFAADRIGDVQRLAVRYPDPANSPVGDYLTAFADFDSDATAGTVDLTGFATSHGPDALTTLHDWAAQQADRIRQVVPSLPAPVAARAKQSVALLTRITRRVDALAARNNCYTVTSGASDALGVLPATGPCDKAPGSTGGVPASPAGGSRFSPSSPATAGRGGSNAVSGTRAAVPIPPTTTFPPTTAVPPPAAGPPSTTQVVPGTVTVPLPLPGVTVPPLLPGLPGVRVGQ
jgi:hypothetical protein